MADLNVYLKPLLECLSNTTVISPSPQGLLRIDSLHQQASHSYARGDLTLVQK